MQSLELQQLEWLAPWRTVDDEERQSLEQQLRRELTAGHVLHGREARPVGRRDDRDDVLFQVESPSQLAVVHLAYARPKDSQAPHTMLLDSLQEFIEACMVPDHEEFTDEVLD